VPTALGALFAISIPVLFLSLSHMMPESWTRYHSYYAALRHWSWLPIVIIFLNNGRYFWYRSFGFVQDHAWLLAFIYYVVSRAVMLASGDRGLLDPLLYHVSATTTPILICLMIGLFARKRPAWQDFLIFILFLPAMVSSTHFLSWVVAYGLRILPARTCQFVPLGIAIALLAFLSITPHFAVALNAIDGNTGVRSVMWGHVQTAMIETYGLGVGFGTEYFPTDFRTIDQPRTWYLVEEGSDDRLFVSTHSALYDTALRLGVFGTLALLAWFYRYIYAGITISHLDDAPLICCMCSMMLFITAFNPGLVTIYILIMVACLMGLIDMLAYRSAAGLSPGSGARPQ
jgi:hypothetical protein